MTFTNNSGVYTLVTEQLLPVSMHQVWQFFSSPDNLNKLTPADIKFRITSLPEKRIYPGQIITYRIRLFRFYSVNWVTEITQVSDRYMFVDEQRFGPYKMWHHEHVFEETGEGVRMRDKVTFKLPFGILGRLAYWLFVKKKLTNIFSYRKQAVSEFFTKD